MIPKPDIKGGYRGIISLAVPLIIGGSAHLLNMFCDSIFLSRYGALEFKASLPAGTISWTFLSFFICTGGYSSTLVAQYFGAGEHAKCIRAAAQGVWWTLLTLPVLFLLPFVANLAIHLMQHEPELVALQNTYMRWMFASAVPQGIATSLAGYFTGRGKMRLSVVANIIGCAVNIPLNYAFILGNWGCPAMGLKGAAITTFISSCIAPSIIFAYILGDKYARADGLRKTFSFDPHLFRTLVRFGIPSGVQHMLDMGPFTVFTMLAVKASGAEAGTAALRLNHISFSPIWQIGIVTSILCGQFKGADNFRETKRTAWLSLKISWIYAAFAAALFLLFPQTLLGVFLPEDINPSSIADYYRIGRIFLVLVALWGFFDGANIIFMGALRGVGDTKFVMWYIILMGWLLLFPGMILIFKFVGYGEAGIISAWSWLAAYVGIVAAGFIWRWQRGRWYDIKVID